MIRRIEGAVMIILEFENVGESELVAALYRALDVARINGSDLESKIRLLVDEAEAEVRQVPLQ
jgi:hypothetical protein